MTQQVAHVCSVHVAAAQQSPPRIRRSYVSWQPGLHAAIYARSHQWGIATAKATQRADVTGCISLSAVVQHAMPDIKAASAFGWLSQQVAWMPHIASRSAVSQSRAVSGSQTISAEGGS